MKLTFENKLISRWRNRLCVPCPCCVLEDYCQSRGDKWKIKTSWCYNKQLFLMSRVYLQKQITSFKNVQKTWFLLCQRVSIVFFSCVLSQNNPIVVWQIWVGMHNRKWNADLFLQINSSILDQAVIDLENVCIYLIIKTYSRVT